MEIYKKKFVCIIQARMGSKRLPKKAIAEIAGITCIERVIKRIKLFIYASSSSVYGVKNEKNVHEDMSLEPLTDYSKYKAECEKVLKKYQNDNFTTVILRPATVCGFSSRQRMDVIVNLLTNQGFHLKKIKILGGEQLRPNIHINDMVNAYMLLINAPRNLIAGEYLMSDIKT